MNKLSNQEIELIKKHSNATQQDIDQLLSEYVVPSKVEALKFLRIFLLGFGLSFVVAGIIFFFAYNWTEMHKFVKLGIAQGLCVSFALVGIYSKWSPNIKNSILTCATLMVGAVFAVFGQIYQTGANAYDFFLGWTIFVSIWVFVANYHASWLVYFLLINTTVYFYGQQDDTLPRNFDMFMLLIANTIILLSFTLLPIWKISLKQVKWLLHPVHLTLVFIIFIAANEFIHSNYHKSPSYSLYSFLLGLPITGLSIYYGLKNKSLFHIAIYSFLIITIVSSSMAKISLDEGMFLLNALFVVASISVLIWKMIELQKSWNNGIK